MKTKIICGIFLITLLMIIINFTLNLYFSNRLDQQIATKNLNHKINREKLTKTLINVEYLIREKSESLKPVYLNRNPRYFIIKNKILNNFIPKQYDNVVDAWNSANSWTSGNEVYPKYDSQIGNIIYALQNEPILAAKNSPRGTQLKLVLNLPEDYQIIFKPKWYAREHTITGPVYAGFDRHTAEIFGFYLGAVLNFRSTPIVTGRRINLKHIYDVANPELKNTMLVLNNKNTTQYCVYGKCYYCKPSQKVCGKPNEHIIEGVVMHLIPGTFSKNRSPWQRTYQTAKAIWEENDDYCETLKPVIPETRLLDLVDASIFDFLIQNGDRHHYETRDERILLLDNGKAFGNPYVDFFDILAPLYQCCIIKKSTWTRLLIFSGGTLTEIIKELTKNDPLYPILTEDHYDAVERRLLYVFSAVEFCIKKFGKENIFR